MHSTRSLFSSGVCLLTLGLPGCFGHHTADEKVILPQEQASVDAESDAGVLGDAQLAPAPDAASGSNCANQTDIIAQLLCQANAGGGGLDDLIGGLLGGGMTGTNCAKQTDPVAQLLCQVTATGGGGLEGLLGGGLGGLLGDGGVERVITGALAEVIRGILDDLIGSLLGGGRDAGAGGFLGGGNVRGGAGAGGLFGGLLGQGVGSSDNKALDLPARSAAECESAAPEDQLTRLICLRQRLDQLSPAVPNTTVPNLVENLRGASSS